MGPAVGGLDADKFFTLVFRVCVCKSEGWRGREMVRGRKRLQRVVLLT